MQGQKKGEGVGERKGEEGLRESIGPRDRKILAMSQFAHYILQR